MKKTNKLFSFAFAVAMILASCFFITKVNADEVTVTFDSKGGSVVASQAVEIGQFAEEPADPTKAGYEFIGWSVGQEVVDPATGDGNYSFYDFSTPVTGELTLVANYLKYYTVTWNFGDLADPVSEQVLAGDFPEFPIGGNVPEAIGSYWVVWFYTDPEFQNEYDGESIYQDTIIYVQYEFDEYTIGEVDVEAEIPKAGDEATVETYYDEYDDETYYDWDTVTPQLDIVIPEDAHYTIYDGEVHNYWLASFEDEDYDTPFTGTFEAGQDYYLELVLQSESGYVFSPNLTSMSLNGKQADKVFYNETWCDDDDVCYSILSLGFLIHIPNEYTILDGENQTIGADEELTVTASGNLDRFLGIQVDGNDVDEADYDVKQGSTIVTLKAEYLNTLNVGEHTLTFLYDDGEVSTTFNIARPIIAASSLNPKTGDNVIATTVTMIISVAGMAVISLNKKRYNN